MRNDRAARYRSLLRWYPASWRARHGDAVIATLMDADDAEGRSTPSPAERRALIAGGLHERVLARERLSPVGIAALICSVVFSIWYQSTITWSPEISYDGAVGPFANPSIIVSVLSLVALALAVFSRGRSARFVALLSVATVIAIGVLSAALSWLGPSLPTVVIFAGLGLMPSSSWRSARDAVRPTAALCLIILGGLLTEFALSLQNPFESAIGAAEVLAAAAALVGALALAWPAAPVGYRRSTVQ